MFEKLTKNNQPEELETVWAYNEHTKFVALACLIYVEDCWLWAVCNGIIYAENGKIVSECETGDYDFTHWSALPELPKT